MYGTGVIAHRAELFGFAVGRVGRIVDGICRPDTDEAIYSEESAEIFPESLRGVLFTSSSCDEPFAIGRNMAAIDFKVLLLPAMGEPYWTDVLHGSDLGVSAYGACLAEFI